MSAHNQPEIKLKKFIVIPRDAYELLERRYASFEEAGEAAKDACAENAQTMMVVELKAVAARVDRPVALREV